MLTILLRFIVTLATSVTSVSRLFQWIVNAVLGGKRDVFWDTERR